MNEEIDENDFYQQDFTTASDWEVFIARLEEIINQWKSDDLKSEENESANNVWNIKSEQLRFVDFDFTLSLHRKSDTILSESIEDEKVKNPFDKRYDFTLYDPDNISDHSCLARWYGIDQFIVLSPSGNIAITTESRIKILLSSVYVVAANLNHELPIFVQIREKWQQCYLGVHQHESVRTNLEMIHLKTCPRLCQYLSGLLEVFKSKIVSPMALPTILVSLQYTYTLTDFGSFAWKQPIWNVQTLQFGATMEPISAMVLKTSWSRLNHRAVRESESYSNFRPIDAAKWSCLVNTTHQPLSLLGESLTEFLHLLGNTATIYDILGDFAASSSPESNPLDLLTEPTVPTITSLLHRAARNSISKSRRGTAPLSEDLLVSMLYFLFPDADADTPNPYTEFNSNQPQTEGEGFNLGYECRGFKCSPPDGLLWRLTVLLSNSLQSLGGIKAFSHLWFEFVQEMRYRWEKSISIPGLLPGYPDLRTNLVHQKLQMLNCCIERRQARENPSATYDSAESSSTDEEFFDCDSAHEESKKKQKYSLWNQPVGRLGKFDGLKLIQTGDDLYIPVTQEPVPKSEDQLEEDTDVLLKLGSDAQGSELRAKMMSASLLSDMESFKAANPGSVLEDFIRWYSPRDWEEEEEEMDEWGQRKGQLSGRMMIEDNFWVQTWKSAKPVPANRQKRLFDDTREAEKVLHYLDSRNLSQICHLVIPILNHAAIYRLAEECEPIDHELPGYVERLRALIRTAERISREGKLQTRRFEGFVQEVTALELNVAQVNSLIRKLNPTGSSGRNLSNLIANLVMGREIELADKAESDIGGRIVAMFTDVVQNVVGMELLPEDEKNALFPQPSEKEIVMRVTVPRPASYSAECPQFLRAILAKNEFRLVGAFSEDIVFF